MKYWYLLLTIIFISGCANQAAPQPEQLQTEDMLVKPSTPEVATSRTVAKLPDLGEAPELTNEVWLNVDQPLRLANLRGQVVLLDMWTFG